MKNLFVLFFIFLIACSTPPTKTKVIFDTDFGGDADDLGALAMLHHFVNRDECDLLGVMCWNIEPYAVSAISAVNRYYGNPQIPIGTRKDQGEHVDWNHGKVLSDNFKFDVDAKSAPESTILYRQLLSKSEDHDVTIVTVGPMSNILRLIDSQPDSISPLNGKELITQKVKEFVIMGGQFPSGPEEWNFNGNMPGVTKSVIEQLDIPITFLGYEVGLNIKSGEVFNKLEEDTPLYAGFMHFSKYCPWLNDRYEGKIYDNSTYDQTAVLYAVRNGVGEYWERIEGGRCLPDSTGGNTWEEALDSKHSYLKLIKPEEEMSEIIEGFMLGEF
ncbi:MAG: nucleoside hydrolase [Bacteroidota bacterium]